VLGRSIGLVASRTHSIAQFFARVALRVLPKVAGREGGGFRDVSAALLVRVFSMTTINNDTINADTPKNARRVWAGLQKHGGFKAAAFASWNWHLLLPTKRKGNAKCL
jgi:hypothetical protein